MHDTLLSRKNQKTKIRSKPTGRRVPLARCRRTERRRRRDGPRALRTPRHAVCRRAEEPPRNATARCIRFARIAGLKPDPTRDAPG